MRKRAIRTLASRLRRAETTIVVSTSVGAPTPTFAAAFSRSTRSVQRTPREKIATIAELSRITRPPVQAPTELLLPRDSGADPADPREPTATPRSRGSVAIFSVGRERPVERPADRDALRGIAGRPRSWSPPVISAISPASFSTSVFLMFISPCPEYTPFYHFYTKRRVERSARQIRVSKRDMTHLSHGLQPEPERWSGAMLDEIHAGRANPRPSRAATLRLVYHVLRVACRERGREGGVAVSRPRVGSTADRLGLLGTAVLCSLALVVPVSAQRTFRFDSDFIPVLVPDNGCVVRRRRRGRRRSQREDPDRRRRQDQRLNVKVEDLPRLPLRPADRSLVHTSRGQHGAIDRPRQQPWRELR